MYKMKTIDKNNKSLWELIKDVNLNYTDLQIKDDYPN